MATLADLGLNADDYPTLGNLGGWQNTVGTGAGYLPQPTELALPAGPAMSTVGSGPGYLPAAGDTLVTPPTPSSRNQFLRSALRDFQFSKPPQIALNAPALAAAPPPSFAPLQGFQGAALPRLMLDPSLYGARGAVDIPAFGGNLTLGGNYDRYRGAGGFAGYRGTF